MEEHINATMRRWRRMSNPPYRLIARDASKHLEVFIVDTVATRR